MSAERVRPVVRDGFEARLQKVALQTEQLLDALLSASPSTGEVERPRRLLEAMRHATLGGGKRLRPLLVVETATMLGAAEHHALRAGAAVELLHVYSLVHDDLPSMDNDDLRRGRPTVHRAYDEATAILAGDALQTLAFATLAHPATHPDPDRRLALVADLAASAGLGGMVGGQALDLAAEGREGEAVRQALGTEEGVLRIQGMKTGALIRHAVRAGAILAGASLDEIKALDDYARALGLAFQIRDDLLDVDGDAATLGKAAGKDQAAGKATFVSLLGVDGARQRLDTVSEEALAALAPFAARAEVLAAVVRFNRERTR